MVDMVVLLDGSMRFGW